MDDDLICNFKKCRKRITSIAWVTSCSHIFCEEDGNREFSKQQVCPACDSVLSSQLDFVQVDIHPGEQYKSMVLAGQRPEVVMEICSRAMSFWTYQAHQERSYQEYVASKAMEKSQKQEGYYEQLLSLNQTELTSLKSQVGSLRKDLETVKTKYNKVSEKLTDKTRQYQKLQGMYETLRRRNINPSSLDGETDRGPPHVPHPSLRKHHPFELPVGSITERNAPSLSHGLHKRQSTDFFLASGQTSMLPPSTNLHLNSNMGGMATSQVTTQRSATVYQFDPDPSLAAAVNTAALQTEQHKPNEKFMIKMNKGSASQNKHSK